MKNQKGKRVLITSVLGLAAFWAFIIIEKNTTILKGIDIYIFFLIIIIGAISMYIAFKKDKEEK